MSVIAGVMYWGCDLDGGQHKIMMGRHYNRRRCVWEGLCDAVSRSATVALHVI